MTERRWFNADEAASYLSLSVEGFRRKVRAGVIPEPSRVLGAALPRWDRAALDATMSGGIASRDPMEAAEAIVQKMLARGPKRRRQQPQNS